MFGLSSEIDFSFFQTFQEIFGRKVDQLDFIRFFNKSIRNGFADDDTGYLGHDVIDAFTMLDWSQSRCLVCGECHEEVVYAYPPTVLARQTANKAMQDGAKMILVVPLAVTSPHWQKLLRASVVANSERCMRVRGVQGPGERVARIRG